jgi:cell division initiation protein
MFLSPSEVRETKLAGKGLRGYDRAGAQRLIDDVLESYEQVWNERDALKSEVEQLNQKVAQSEDLERLLRDTLVVAQRSAEELKAQARLEAEATIDEGRRRSDEVVGDAERRISGLAAEISRLERVESQIRSRFVEQLQGAISYWEGNADSKSLVDDLVSAVPTQPPVQPDEQG